MSEEADINQQHHELLNKLYKLRDAVKDGQSLESIERIIDDVISYTRFHLESEERILKQYGYPEIEWHKVKHKELLEDVLNFKKKLRYVDESEFIEWFNHWPLARLLAHIAFADKQAEDYIVQSGAKE